MSLVNELLPYEKKEINIYCLTKQYGLQYGVLEIYIENSVVDQVLLKAICFDNNSMINYKIQFEQKISKA